MKRSKPSSTQPAPGAFESETGFPILPDSEDALSSAFVPVTTPPPPSPPRAWAEIDLSALRHNLGVARQFGGPGIMAVLKAGAYGHGLEPLARALDGEGLAFFGVANVGEARRLSDAGIRTPVYLLGPTLAEERDEAVARGWTPCLSTIEEASHFDRLAQRRDVRVTGHLTIDTGMGRGGFLPEKAAAALDEIRTLPAIRLGGIGSHLPSADEDPEFTQHQFETFDGLVSALFPGLCPEAAPASGGNESRRSPHAFHIHLANSAGMLGYVSRTANLVRPGLMLYGASPLPEHQGRLRAVMTLKSRVSVIRELPAGHGVSYGRTFITTRPTRVATIGIGYGDGYPRHLSNNRPEVVIRDRRVPIIGRVTMDQVMADVTDLPDCRAGDEVELFGPRLPVREIAEKAGTIPWEIFTLITPRVTRIYRD